MLRSVFLAEAWRRRRSTVWWLAAGFSYLVFIGGVYPTIRSNAAQIDALLEGYPDIFKAVFGVGDGLSYASPEGFLHLQVFSLVLPLVLLAYAIGFGARAIAGEEEGGVLDLVLATPVTRRSVVLQKAASLAAHVVVVAAAMTAALLLDGPLFFGGGVPVGRLAGAMLSTVLLAVLFGTTALAVGAGTGRRAVAVGATSGGALAAYLVFALSALVPWLRGPAHLSPFYFSNGAQPIRFGIEWPHAAVLATLAVVALGTAVVLFDRRDVRV